MIELLRAKRQAVQEMRALQRSAREAAVAEVAAVGDLELDALEQYLGCSVEDWVLGGTLANN